MVSCGAEPLAYAWFGVYGPTIPGGSKIAQSRSGLYTSSPSVCSD